MIDAASAGRYIGLAAALLFVLRGGAVVATLGSGASGGSFVPQVSLGAIAGGAFAAFAPCTGSLFPIVGMAAFPGSGQCHSDSGTRVRRGGDGRSGVCHPGLVAAAAAYVVSGARTMSGHQRPGYELKDPKSETSRRTIEVPAILVDALAFAKNEHEDRRARPELAGTGYRLEYGPLVFSEDDGEPWWPSRFEWAWQEFRRSSRVAPRFHDLRHTALSLLLRQGNSPKVVQEIAGHHSSAYTMDTYCWSDRRTQRAAADSIGDLFSGALHAVEDESGNKSTTPL